MDDLRGSELDELAAPPPAKDATVTPITPSDAFMKKVLLTGAAGIVGSALRPLLARRYEHILLTDIEEIADLSANESFRQGDIADAEFVAELASSVEGIVHLAGRVGSHYTFDDVLGPNIVGTYNVFEAARRSGVKQVVFASSHHAVGFVSRSDKVDENTLPRPDSWYGVSKVFGESVSSYYADKFGLNVLAIRIGYVGEKVIDERRLHTWNSPQDLANLIDIGLANRDLGYQLVYGVSECPDSFFNNAAAMRLGYIPGDRALDHLADESIPQQRPDPSDFAGRFIGGPFTAEGREG